MRGLISVFILTIIQLGLSEAKVLVAASDITAIVCIKFDYTYNTNFNDLKSTDSVAYIGNFTNFMSLNAQLTPTVLSLTSGSTIVKSQFIITAASGLTLENAYIKLSSLKSVNTTVSPGKVLDAYPCSGSKHFFSFNLINLSILLAFLFIYA